MSFAAAIVHFRDSHRTAQLIEAIDSIPTIIVILHSSYTNDRSPNVIWLEQPNRGYAAGLNAAAEWCLKAGRIDTVAALNPDIVALNSQSLSDLYSRHQVSGSACTFPLLLEGKNLIDGYRFSRWGTLQITKEPEWYPGACFLFSLDAWKKIGGFDESFFHYFEDWDYCKRLQKAGFPIHQVREIVIQHQAKSGVDFPASELPKFAVRNHLIALQRSDRLGPLVFLNVIFRHFAYLFRWKKGWRGLRQWSRGITEFVRSPGS